jgi:imidazolonepropionase-like amidohydrolase
MRAIQSATRDAAECMGWAGKVGAIRAGAYADLIAVAGDPLRNIRELESVGWVMKGGEVQKDALAK